MAKQSVGKGKKKGLHVSDKAQGLTYKAQNKYSKNRMLVLVRHCSINENDMQALKVLNNCPVTGFLYRRKKPGILGNKTKQKKFKVIKAGYGLLTERASFREKMYFIKKEL